MSAVADLRNRQQKVTKYAKTNYQTHIITRLRVATNAISLTGRVFGPVALVETVFFDFVLACQMSGSGHHLKINCISKP